MLTCTKSEFDVFARKPIQSAILGNFTTLYKPIAPVEQSVLEFAIPGDNEHYVDLNIHLMVKGKFTKLDGTTVALDDRSTGVNNFLHSLFSQLNVTLNGVSITPSEDLYHYRSYFETLLTYGHDAVKSHLTNCFWYIDSVPLGDALKAGDSNSGWKERFEKSKNSKEIVMYGKLHGDIFNVSTLMIPGVNIQVKLTKSKESFYLLSESSDPKVKFQFLDATLYVRKIKPSPNILLAHSKALMKTNARYDVTRVDVRSFTFGSGQSTLSIDNAVLGPLPKRILFAMTGNTNFSGSPDSNPFEFKHYDLEHFAIYMNGQQIPSEGLSVDMSHEKGSTLAYQSLFSGSGIHHSNSGIQITHDLYINGHFLLLFDLTPDGAASEGHVSLPTSGNVRIELRFRSKLPQAITCLLYCEYENSIFVDKDKRVRTDF